MAETLLDYLRRQNPSVVRAEESGNNSTRSSKSQTKNRSYIRPTMVERWNEINHETLDKMYGNILGISKTRGTIAVRDAELVVRNEDGVGAIVLQWNKEMMAQALEESQTYLGSEYSIFMVKSDSANPMKNRLNPDWATIYRKKGSTSRTQQPSIMPGETKYNWSSQDITYGSVSWKISLPNTHPAWPICQIFTYCVHLQSRYGYIITDRELVLLRVGLHGGSPESPNDWQSIEKGLRRKGKIELCSVPWSTHGRDAEENKALTINTALWWLHLQAVRKRTINWEYPPLVQEVLRPSREDSTRPSQDDTQHSNTHEQNSKSDDDLDEISYSFTASHDDGPQVPRWGCLRSRSAARTERGVSTTSTIATSQSEDHNVGTALDSFRSQNSGASGRTTRSKRKAVPNDPVGGVQTRGKRKKKQ